MFLCKGRWNHPHQVGYYLLFRSTLHISQNTLSINWLILTEHPFIPLSAVLPKLLSNLPSAFVCRKNLSRRKKFYK